MTLALKLIIDSLKIYTSEKIGSLKNLYTLGIFEADGINSAPAMDFRVLSSLSRNDFWYLLRTLLGTVMTYMQLKRHFDVLASHIKGL